jgi:transposase
LVGLDVHATKVVAPVLDVETGSSGLVATSSYEAGPTGYALARALADAAVECLRAAPGKVPLGATDRVETDRGDAEHLVRLLLAGRLHPVGCGGWPKRGCAIWTAREDIRGGLMRRHRLSKPR